jgi:TonB family protein
MASKAAKKTMSTGTSPAAQVDTKRSVPRFKLTVPAEVTVLRSGMPENVPGRTVELGEGGIGVVLASRLLLGESVRVEFLLPHTTAPVRATAVVRYQRELCCGLQFVRLPAEQQSTIRSWTRCEAALSFSGKDAQPDRPAVLLPEETISQVPATPRNWGRWIAAAVFALIAAATLQWWYWQQEWKELEAQVPQSQTISTPQLLKVPGDVMQQRLRHRVAPDYPPEARRAGVQGTVLLDVVVSATGAVTDVEYLSGPEALSRAALDAVRWWKYEPYLLNNQPVPVETTVAVNFHLAN